MSDELDDILKGAARENLQAMGISERSQTPLASNSVALLVKRMRSLADLASHKEPAISEALIDGVVQIERLTRAAAEVEMMAVTLDARDREIERLRAALAGLKDLTCGECVPCNRINAEIDKALSGEPASGHGIIYDRPGWLCSICGGWNHLRDSHCTHTHAVRSAEKASESRFLCQHCGREFGTIAERGIHESACKAPKVPEVREWHFDRYRNGRPMAEGVKVHATTEAEARDKAKSLSISAGHWPSDELRLSQNGSAS